MKWHKYSRDARMSFVSNCSKGKPRYVATPNGHWKTRLLSTSFVSYTMNAARIRYLSASKYLKKTLIICLDNLTKFKRLNAISPDSNADLRSVLFGRQSTTVQQRHNSKVSNPDTCYADIKRNKWTRAIIGKVFYCNLKSECMAKGEVDQNESDKTLSHSIGMCFLVNFQSNFVKTWTNLHEIFSKFEGDSQNKNSLEEFFQI